MGVFLLVPATHAIAACSTPTAAYVRCEGENTTAPTGTTVVTPAAGASNQAFLRFDSNVTASVRDPQTPAGSNTVIAGVRGTVQCPGANGWPRGDLIVNGVSASFTVSSNSTFQRLGVSYQLRPGSNTFAVRQANQAPGDSCHLILDYVEAPRFKAFAPTSPWNTKVSDISGATVASSAQIWQNSELGSSVKLLGARNNTNCGSPVFFAALGDAYAAGFSGNSSFAQTGIRYDPSDREPVPPYTAAETCGPPNDGHLDVVTPARDASFETFQTTQIGSASQNYVATGGAKFDLSGTGYAAKHSGWVDSNGDAHGVNSARGSGTNLVDTSLRADEALYGVNHALGCTVPGDLSVNYLYPPAAKTDGTSPTLHAREGERWVLDPNYPESGFTTAGQLNIVHALKDYGCFIVDLGEKDGFAIDLDTNDPPCLAGRSCPSGMWEKAGVTDVDTLSSIAGSNFRLVSDPSQTEYTCAGDPNC